MLKQLLVVAFSATFAAGLGYAGQPTVKVTIPVEKTPANSGKLMYANYCAPCHGMDGKGSGSVAAALRTPPADLTVLARNNHGKYPDSHVATVLQNGVEIPAHGSAEMPAWGPRLATMNQANPQERLLRISNLSRYLETMQVK